MMATEPQMARHRADRAPARRSRRERHAPWFDETEATRITITGSS